MKPIVRNSLKVSLVNEGHFWSLYISKGDQDIYCGCGSYYHMMEFLCDFVAFDELFDYCLNEFTD